MITCNLRVIVVAAVFIALITSFSSVAHAHKVNIFAYAEGGKVHTESYFSDGTRASGCKVTVEDSSGRQLVEGTTDREGMFAFDIPGPEDLRIVLHASMGHKNDYVIKASELEAAMPEKDTAGKTATEAVGSAKDNPPVNKAAKARRAYSEHNAVKEHARCPTADDLRSIVDETVEARLKPLYGMLSEMREASEKPRVSEVIGGIGYIMGVMGVILYFKSRKV